MQCNRLIVESMGEPPLCAPCVGVVTPDIASVNGYGTDRINDRGHRFPHGSLTRTSLSALQSLVRRHLFLDQRLRPVPDGVAGETVSSPVRMWARGYVASPALTSERFVANPHAVGDSGCIERVTSCVVGRHDRALEYLGRNDAQVKVRGVPRGTGGGRGGSVKPWSSGLLGNRCL